ncbi:hypothetical protein BKD09_19540 [Bradyrhizobium japonicum]|uniref:Glycosyltransferase RgtA/B/C/D-like domain-containing protein n=1 Tax=Bradyrhizobium japonicum TaxID=375 RepID=A0A1L3FB57_BRAJP|nr:hypothetical protein [Bradyrhizobium japonicum]APG10523.1 hypothetical protein BKD09_19540 [Bradyrhizobium japonicum]
MRELIARLDRRPIRVTLLLAALMLFFVPAFLLSLNEAGKLEHSWSSAAIWVKSADCARTTKAILAICQGDRLLPIADLSAGDDPGPPLVLGLYAALSGAVATETDVSRVNTILNYVGLVSLAGLLFRLRLPFLSFLVLTVGAVIANKLHSLGPHPGHLGVACLVALLPLAILGIPSTGPSRTSWWLWMVVGLLGLAVGMVFREAIGLMGVVAALLALGVFCSLMKMRHMGLAHLVVLVTTVLTILTPYSILRARDAVFDIAPSTRMEQHGAWHNLYIGLGVVENPFGIVWNDDDGVRAVKEVSPGTLYLSAEYYSILKRKYFEIVLHHPIEVITIYLKKVMKALTTYNMIYLLIVVSGVFAWARLSLVRYSAGWSSYDAVFSVSAVFVATFLGQAALFHYTELYLFPVKIFLVLLFGVMVEILLTLARAGRFEPASRRA